MKTKTTERILQETKDKVRVEYVVGYDPYKSYDEESESKCSTYKVNKYGRIEQIK